MKYNAKQFAEMNDVPYQTAYGFLRFLGEKGIVKTNRVKEGRGPGTIFFDLPKELKMTLHDNEEDKKESVVSTETASLKVDANATFPSLP